LTIELDVLSSSKSSSGFLALLGLERCCEGCGRGKFMFETERAKLPGVLPGVRRERESEVVGSPRVLPLTFWNESARPLSSISSPASSRAYNASKAFFFLAATF